MQIDRLRPLLARNSMRRMDSLFASLESLDPSQSFADALIELSDGRAIELAPISRPISSV
jgi:hypothetical protein